MNEVVKAVGELLQTQAEKKRDEKQVYKTIIIDVMNHVRAKNNVGRSNMVYRVPFIVYGNPRYDLRKATYHIMKELTRCGIVVFPYENNHVYIDWSMLTNPVKPQLPTNNKRMVRFES
jgi:hypothetical protein